MLTESIIRRFWQRSERNEHGFLEWTGAPFRNGYGGLMHTRGPIKKLFRVHRIAWEIYHGREPKGFVCHHCDRPLCVDERCLYEGDQTSNMADMMSRGRSIRGRNPTAKLTMDQVRAIRDLVRHTSQQEVARLFGRSGVCINHIVSGYRWGWLV